MFHELQISQIDMETVYLIGDLKDEVCITILNYTKEVLKVFIGTREVNGDIDKWTKLLLEEMRKENKLCLLDKAFCGLRQAGPVW